MSDIRNFFTKNSASKRRANDTSIEVGTAKKLKEDNNDSDHEPEPSTTSIKSENSSTLESLLTEAKWKELLAPEFKKSYFKQLEAFLVREEKKNAKIFPPKQDIFAALNLCPFEKIKLVIIGQDPYHGDGQAHGLCFSVARGVPPPPSLKNIYKEACSDVGISAPSHGCLLNWCEQGVLMLNTVLTVRSSEPNSHKKQGWETFTDAIIKLVNDRAENVVFLLWGKPAHEKGSIISRTKHCVLTSSHPSPLGATKTAEPFIGSKCFSKANAYLEEHNKGAIDWSL